MADEEERLERLLQKKANAAFEQKRKEALQNYKGHGAAGNFHLAEDTPSPSRSYVSPRHEENPSVKVDDERFKFVREREEDEARRKQAEQAGQGELAKYLEDQSRKEREFRQKQQEEDERKRRELASQPSSLAKYEEAVRQRDIEAKRQREQAELDRQAELKDKEDKLRAYRERQEAEEREFRRRREEEERKKRETLEQMERADRERRDNLLRQAKEQEAAKRQQEAAQKSSAPTHKCTTCLTSLIAEQIVQVKGRPYCYRCSQGASADQCSGCQKPLLGSFMKAGARKFHPECLKCEQCGCALTDGFRMRRNKMCCIKCSQTSL